MNQGQEMFDQFFMERARACLKNAFWYMYPKGMIHHPLGYKVGSAWQKTEVYRAYMEGFVMCCWNCLL